MNDDGRRGLEYRVRAPPTNRTAEAVGRAAARILGCTFTEEFMRLVHDALSGQHVQGFKAMLKAVLDAIPPL